MPFNIFAALFTSPHGYADGHFVSSARRLFTNRLCDVQRPSAELQNKLGRLETPSYCRFCRVVNVNSRQNNGVNIQAQNTTVYCFWVATNVLTGKPDSVTKPNRLSELKLHRTEFGRTGPTSWFRVT